MYIKNIKIKNFRNISDCYIEPSKKINFICGLNAQGKTNLIEAIYFSSIFKSFRTNIKTDLIKKNESNLLVKIEIINNDVKNDLKIIYDRKKLKKILINNQSNKNIHEIINSIIYFPD
jgi:DNA replication and repair protein RecF